MSTDRTGTGPDVEHPGFIERLFELRSIIAILFGIYGIVCTVWGLAFTTADELRRAAGINVNLIAGIGMIVVAAAFATWALRSPLEEARSTTEEQQQPERRTEG